VFKLTTPRPCALWYDLIVALRNLPARATFARACDSVQPLHNVNHQRYKLRLHSLVPVNFGLSRGRSLMVLVRLHKPASITTRLSVQLSSTPLPNAIATSSKLCPRSFALEMLTAGYAFWQAVKPFYTAPSSGLFAVSRCLAKVSCEHSALEA
jgi:hypothetical protein